MHGAVFSRRQGWPKKKGAQKSIVCCNARQGKGAVYVCVEEVYEGKQRYMNSIIILGP
jgi:hypothetical protein